MHKKAQTNQLVRAFRRKNKKENYPFKASAPATISNISLVIAA